MEVIEWTNKHWTWTGDVIDLFDTKKIVLTFTVKKHEIFRGKKQTLVQRVSWELVSPKEEVACA